MTTMPPAAPALTDPRLGNALSNADVRALTGEHTSDAQRDACKATGVPYTQRRVALPHGGTVNVDECNVWATPDVLALADSALPRWLLRLDDYDVPGAIADAERAGYVVQCGPESVVLSTWCMQRGEFVDTVIDRTDHDDDAAARLAVLDALAEVSL